MIYLKGNTSPISLDVSSDDKFTSSTKNTPSEYLNILKSELENLTTIKNTASKLNEVKEEIYAITGGHRVLFEIREFIKKIQAKKENDLDDIKKLLSERIENWKNSLSV